MRSLRVLALSFFASLPMFSACAHTQQFADMGELKLESGASIHECKLGYRTLGTLNAEKSNAVLFPTWFTGTSKDLLGIVSDHGYVDPGQYYWILVDAIGDGVSCSPSNSATQHGLSFPEFTIRDMVEAEHRLLTEKLGLHHLHAVVGVSMGGMQTFQWMVSYPDFMDVAVPVVGSPQLSSYDKLLWSTEEVAMVNDPEYVGGRYTTNPKLKTVALVHMLNLMTPQARVEHTTPSGFEKFFKDTENQGIGDTDANNWRWQIHAMLTQDVGKGASLEEAAAKVKARVLVVNATQDHMVNPLAAEKFAPLIHAKLLMLEGDCGHISPGCEGAKLKPAISEALK